MEQVKERVRTGRHGGTLDEIGRDIRYAFRMLTRNPGFSAVVVVTLALGIGANTAIFSLIDALMLRSLPVRNPHELVQLTMRLPDEKGPAGDSFSYAIVRALADRKEIFAGVAGFTGYTFTTGSGESIRKVPGALVTGEYFETLGLTPASGRLLTRLDDQTGAPLAVVISDHYWEREFGRHPDVVGQSLLLSGAPATIVGVSPPGFVGANVGSPADMTVAIGAFGSVNRLIGEVSGPGNFWLRILARPAPGLSPTQANARLATAWAQMWDAVIASHWPTARRQAFAEARWQLEPGGTGWSFMRDIYRMPLMVLMAVVAVVLLIACANVASLMLARASARQREAAVRLALGAGRGRIVRQLLIEAVLLAAIGAAFGVLLAWTSGRALVEAISTGPWPVTFDLTPDLHILGFTGAVAVATAILFGLAPAFQLSDSPSPTLKEDGRTSASSSRLLSSLVAGQVALSLLLLVGAGLFVRTLRNLQQLDAGFNRQGVLIVDLERGSAVPPNLLDDIRRVPGVVSASESTHTPLSGSTWSDIAVPKGQPLPESDTALFVGAGPRFFETMQTPLIAGREFTERDVASAPPVAIVNQTYARRYFKDRSPIGQYLSAVVQDDRRDLEIVGAGGRHPGRRTQERRPGDCVRRLSPAHGTNVHYPRNPRGGTFHAHGGSDSATASAEVPRHADRGPPAVGTSRRRHRQGARHRATGRRLRPAGARPGLRRPLRPSGIHRRTTHEGTGHPHRARRPAAACHDDGARPCRPPGFDRHPDRTAGRVARLALGQVAALRPDSCRPGDARGGECGARRRRARRCVRASPSCLAGRSDRGAAARMTMLSGERASHGELT